MKNTGLVLAEWMKMTTKLLTFYQELTEQSTPATNCRNMLRSKL